MNYERLELIGRGGMAEVYRGRRIVSDEPVAMKYLKAVFAEDPAINERFLREAKICYQFQHPNIVKVIDLGQDGARPYLVMELLEGETLRARLRRDGPLPEAEAAHIARQILSALVMAHENGVVHRDIKPGNIFLCRDGTVKVMDFGIARIASMEALTQAGMQIGTSEYMSPEQVRGETISPRSDLYAVGIVLYLMLTGQPPFKGASAIATMQLHLTQPPPPLPPAVPPRLCSVLETALAKDPAARFASAQAMLDALTPQPANPPPHVASKLALPWPALVTAGAVLLALLGWLLAGAR